MGLFSKLFSRRPGGTAVGNILRTVANKATGGVLGTGAMMITQEEYDRKHLTDFEYYTKYGKNKPETNPTVLPYLTQAAGAVLAGAATSLHSFNQAGANAQTAQQYAETGATTTQQLVSGAAISQSSKLMQVIIIIAAFAAAFLIFKKIKNR